MTPLGNHQTNNAERSIQMIKNHLMSGLCSIDPDFPLQMQDRLKQQANIILNLLRWSQIHLQLSAYRHLFAELEYNATALAPPGTKMIEFKPPDKHPT